MSSSAPRHDIRTFVRLVELPLDPFGVHLVCEASLASRSADPNAAPDYRAPTTVCGQIGYRQTDRTLGACAECARGVQEATLSARMACRASLAIRERVATPNGHGEILRG